MGNNNLLSIAQFISRSIGEIVKSSSNLGLLTGKKGIGGDETKIGDQIVEDELKRIIPVIIKKYNIGNCLVVSEETGFWKLGDAQNEQGIFIWIDPIDGSRNMRTHTTPKPYLGFSIALGTLQDLFQKGGFNAVKVGLVRDIFRDDEYWAVRGEGSFLNTARLKTSDVSELEEAVVSAGLDRSGRQLEELLNKGLYKLLLSTKYQRRLGLTTLELCQVATGDYDMHVSLGGGVKVHDIAAAKLIVEEAGGVIELYQEGRIATGESWLRKAVEAGNRGIEEIKFQLLAAGNTTLLQQTKQCLKMG